MSLQIERIIPVIFETSSILTQAFKGTAYSLSCDESIPPTQIPKPNMPSFSTGWKTRSLWRRKLSSDHEKQLIKSSQEVELILAKIYDINEDDIREEYIEAFALAKMLLDNLKKEYKLSFRWLEFIIS